MRSLIFWSVVMALLAGCGPTLTPAGDEAAVAAITARFEDGKGSVTIIRDENLVQFVVHVSGLAAGSYEVTLEGEGKGGVTFGAGNAHAHFGELRGETALAPTQGRLLIWSVHPERVVADLVRPRVVVRELKPSHREAARSSPLEIAR